MLTDSRGFLELMCSTFDIVSVQHVSVEMTEVLGEISTGDMEKRQGNGRENLEGLPGGGDAELPPGRVSESDGWQRVFQAVETASTSGWRSGRCIRCGALQIAQCNERTRAGRDQSQGWRERQGCQGRPWMSCQGLDSA